MKLLSFEHAGRESYGALVGEGDIDRIASPNSLVRSKRCCALRQCPANRDQLEPSHGEEHLILETEVPAAAQVGVMHGDWGGAAGGMA